MRIFANCKEAISEIERDLFEMGIESHSKSMQNKKVEDDDNYKTKEMLGYTFTILDSSDKDKMVNDCLDWCNAEFRERISGYDDIQKHIPINPGEAYKLRENVWSEFLVNKKFDYTYNERMYQQIQKMIDELKSNPESRQTLIQFYDRNIDQSLMGGRARIPCSLHYQLMIREGKLNIIYMMRSSDFYTHFKNDIWHAVTFRDWVAEKLNLPTGRFIMFISSLHAYKKDFPIGVY